MPPAPGPPRDGPLAGRAPPVPAPRLAVSARTLGATWRVPLPPPPNTATAAPPPPNTTTAPMTAGVSERRLTPLVATRSSSWVKRRSEEHTSELQSLAYIVCRLLLEKKIFELEPLMRCMAGGAVG